MHIGEICRETLVGAKGMHNLSSASLCPSQSFHQEIILAIRFWDQAGEVLGPDTIQNIWNNL